MDSRLLIALYVCSTTFINCPADASQTLGIKLPFLVMIIKNLKKYFTFEVQVVSSTPLLSLILFSAVYCRPVILHGLF